MCFPRLAAVSYTHLDVYKRQGQVGLSDMSGPVGIVTTISDVGQGSTSLFMAAANIGYLTALIAINLAVMNLLPIPALDGGQIFIMFVTTLVTKVTKRPVNPKYAGYLNMSLIHI